MLIGCASFSLDTYKPKSADEEAIIKVLKVNRETIGNRDLSGHLATYRDNASIMIYYNNDNRPNVSKKAYAAWVPTSIMWGNPGELLGINVTVSGDTAVIKCTHRGSQGYSSLTTITMVKENDKWLIKSWSFGRYA